MQIHTLLAQAPSLDEVVGGISPPPGVQKQIDKAVSERAISAGDNALFFFISNLLKIGTLIMGIWVVFNILLAAYEFITNRDNAAAQTKVKDKLTMSAVGLLLIMVAYTLAGVISLVLFGDAGYILNPEF